jgi:hypothetical protein
VCKKKYILELREASRLFRALVLVWLENCCTCDKRCQWRRPVVPNSFQIFC